MSSDIEKKLNRARSFDEAGKNDEALEEIRRFVSNADREKEKATIDQYMKITNSIAENLDQDNRGKDDLDQNR